MYLRMGDNEGIYPCTVQQTSLKGSGGNEDNGYQGRPDSVCWTTGFRVCYMQLDSAAKVQMYAEYQNYLSNELETMKTDYYPKTLTDAINN